MNWFQKTLDAIRNNADAIKFALILPAAAWAYFEYDAKQTEAKVERTLSYVKQADQGELLAAEMKMTAFWIREDVVKERDVVPKGDKVAFDKFMASKTRDSSFERSVASVEFLQEPVDLRENEAVQFDLRLPALRT